MKFALLITAILLSAGARAQAPADVPTPGAAQACVACHGNSGEGNSTIGAPRIAGQPRYYLLKQLDSYVDGRRRSAVMEPIAKGLPPDVRLQLATYYSQVNAPPAEGARTPASERGRVLATIGDSQRRVQACDNCHGPGGTGEPPAQPYLAGLAANYVSASLNSWKNGTRRNDAGQQMITVVNALTQDDIDAVAQHYASLTPPKPWPLEIVQAPLPKKATSTPASSSTLQKNGGAPAPVRVNQGAATVGGTQGPSGGSASSKAQGKGQGNAPTSNKGSDASQ